MGGMDGWFPDLQQICIDPLVLFIFLHDSGPTPEGSLAVVKSALAVSELVYFNGWSSFLIYDHILIWEELLKNGLNQTIQCPSMFVCAWEFLSPLNIRDICVVNVI